ncbi:isochorismatase [Thalassospira mesophila]|uniref:Isochorismatase n=2 Tax=Thalassospira mesophila TaxID=1293891 RepID=A0A1Y2L0E1_9PROT|nr:isochorismatase [Thalassospira mesophila]
MIDILTQNLPVLIMIDWQQGFRDLDYWGQRNNPDAENNAARLLAHWRAHGGTVIHVQHGSTSPQSRLYPGQPGHDFEHFARPQNGEAVYGKNVNSGFIGTRLEADLRAADRTRLVICGISTDHCVNTTTRMAGNLGFDAILAADACFCFDRKLPDGRVFDAQLVHDVHLASLSGEFATILTTGQILSQVGHCD